MSYREVSEIRDGMRIDWDMPIEMDDGLVLRCDVFGQSRKAVIRFCSATALTASGFTSKTATRPPGSAWSRSDRT